MDLSDRERWAEILEVPLGTLWWGFFILSAIPGLVGALVFMVLAFPFGWLIEHQPRCVEAGRWPTRKS